MQLALDPPTTTVTQAWKMPSFTTLFGYAIIISLFILLLRWLGLPLLRKIRRQKPDTEAEEGYPVDFKNEPRVRSILIQANEAYAEMKPVEAISGEFLIDPFDRERKKKKKDLIYTGLPAYTMHISPEIFPTRISRILYTFLFPFGFRIRSYLRLYDEPCTRSIYTGQLLLPEKKRETLINKGVIDKDGFFLDETKKRFVYEGAYIKPDFSDVDFIKSEFHAYKQSEAVQKTAEAMAKTGQSTDKWVYYVLIVALVAIVLVVLFTSGVIK